MGKNVNEKELLDYLKQLPDWQQRLREMRRPATLDELLPGAVNEAKREALKTRGWYESNGTRYGAFVNAEGLVATAAKVSRTPTISSFDYLKDIKDFKEVSGSKRSDQIALLYRIYQNEGLINNGVNKSAALVSTDGNFYVRRARQGKRPKSKVRDELAAALNWWKERVNARGLEYAITGARGLQQIMEQGSRQSLIEGSYIGVWHPEKVDIPTLELSLELPMFIQTFSSQYIEIPEELVSLGLEQFFWVPPRDVINKILNPKDKVVKELIEQSIPQEFLAELKKDRRVTLPRDRVIHIKHRGVEFQSFGESMLTPILPDILYKRSLQNLEFVTIDSLVNRIVIVKVGDPNPDSHYHNIETAQARLETLGRMFDTVDPNMHILWAGHDIEVVEVGAFDKLLDIKPRFDMALERIRLGMGHPKSLLDGTDAGGQIWAAYEGYRETLRGIVNAWSQAWTALGERIAELNGYDDVELIYVPARAILADQNAGADLTLRGLKAGVVSLHRAVNELGGDYEAERRNRVIEMGLDPDSDELPPDNQIFAPPLGMPGDTRTDPDGNVISPDGEPGRPPNSQREDIAPERDPENRNNRDGQ
jgi:hypothetical protein